MLDGGGSRDDGDEDVRNGSMIKPSPAPPLALSHAVPSILAEARDSFERTAFRVTARVTTAKSLYNVNSPSETLKLNLSYLIFVISNLRTILLRTVTGNSIEFRNRKNFILPISRVSDAVAYMHHASILDEGNRCIAPGSFCIPSLRELPSGIRRT